MEKIALMHKRFGYGQGLCKDCSNLMLVMSTKAHFKCRAYGVSHSVATDWAQKWIACGMKDKPTEGMNAVFKSKPEKDNDDQIPGQMDIYEYMAQIKPRPVEIKGLLDDAYCPSCGYAFKDYQGEKDCDCPECGAKLDWSRWHDLND